MTINENTSTEDIDNLQFFSYSLFSAGGGSGGSTNDISFDKSFLSVSVGWSGYNPIIGGYIVTPIRWSSDNSDIVSVDVTSGLITAINPGRTSVTVTMADGRSASFLVIVDKLLIY